MTQYDYDLIVLGAGSGGVRAGRIAASHGARVAVVEGDRVGGTCVIRGCVPKKLFWHASHFADSFEDSVGFGWSTQKLRFDWPTLIANKDREIARLEGLYGRGLDAAGAELIASHGRLTDAHTVHLDTVGRSITAEKILIATGGRPNPHRDLPGHELAITSDEAFDLKRLPRSIIIAGGGYIAMEFAGIFHGLGVETTVVYRGMEVLSGFDQDLRKAIHDIYERKGIDVRCCTMFERLEKTAKGIRAHLSEGDPIEAEMVMLALGRIPNTDGIGIVEQGVELDVRGAVQVDGRFRTNVPSIFAVGDVTGRVQLTPVAIREGHAFADNEFGSGGRPIDYHLVPTAIFTQPEIGTAGLTEDEAREHYRAVDVYSTRFRPLKDTLSGREERVLMKLVVDADSDKVVGSHILGPEAGEMIQLAGVAMQAGATKADFDATMAVHPTMAEEMVTLRNKTASHIREEAAE